MTSGKIVQGLFLDLQAYVNTSGKLDARLKEWKIGVCNTCGGVSRSRNVNMICMYFQAKFEEYF